MSEQSKGREIWIDYLRCMALLGVIIIHTTAPYYAKFESINFYDWWFSNILNALSRFSVPVFIMISGAVLLGKNYEVKDFYIKRGVRLLLPFIFWSTAYMVFDYLYGHYSPVMLAENFIFSGKASGHLWYLTIIIWLMFFTPFINNFINGKKISYNDFVYMTAVFCLFMILNQISTMGNNIYGYKIDWNIKSFYLYICYFILGYYLRLFYERIPIGNILPLFISSIIIAFASFMNYYSVSNLQICKDWLILDNVGILNFIVSLSIFHVFSINRYKFRRCKIISSIASASFGIYLIHIIIYRILSSIIPVAISSQTGHYPVIDIILSTAFTFCFSYFIIVLLRKIKWFRKVS